MARHYSLLIAAFLLLQWFAAAAWAEPMQTVGLEGQEQIDLSPHLVYAVGSGDWTGEAVATGDVSPRWQSTGEAVPNLGLVADPVWFAVRLRVQEHQPWLLEVAQPLLDHVDIEIWRDGQPVTRVEMGDMRPFSQRPLPHRNLVLPLELAAGGDYLVLARVQTQGSLQFPMQLWEPQAFYSADQTVFALHMMFAGIMLALAVYNLLVFLMVREASYLWYVMTVAFTALVQLQLHGIGTRFLWPEGVSNNAILASLIALNMLAICFFSDNFLRIRRGQPKLSKTVRLVGFAMGVLAVYGMFGDYGVAIRLNIFGAMLGSLFLFSTGIYLWWKGSELARFYVIAWTLLLLGHFILTLTKVGVLEHALLSVHAPQIGAALEVLLLSFALGYRINLERRKRMAAQGEALRIQRQANEELENRVRKRTRDLEKANRQLRELSQIDGLTQVKNRQFFEELLRKEWRRTARDTQHLSVLMLDVDYFKAVNDNYGHQCGDACLKMLGSLLQEQVMRPADVVARYGGEEFVLLLPQTELEGACHVAERARKAVANCQVPCGDQLLSFTISVGVAGCIPSREASFEELVRQADEALYAAKGAGRNRVVWYDAPGDECKPFEE